MSWEIQIALALLLDCLLGDPAWLPHPVRGMGWLAVRVEPVARRWVRNPWIAGVFGWVLVVGAAGLTAGLAIRAGNRIHPLAGDLLGIWILYTTLAARDLARHSGAVHAALASGDLTGARLAVGRIVGRDTAQLDASGISRAAVETVAESTLDGVTAPLFFGMLFGPIGAIVYRAINTLDSMWGHKDERYLAFGWASARIDDVANWIPARLTGAVMVVGSALLGLRAKAAWGVLARDARKHPSPNSGFPEAAMAGALGVRLGGTNYYDGEPESRPEIGEPVNRLEASHIIQANRLMYATVFLFTGIGLAIRALILSGLWD